MPSDRELIEQIRERNTDAFDILFERYRHAIHKRLLRIVRDESAAEDLGQEVFLRLWTCAAQWDGRGELGAWLYRIATNLALNHLRTVHRRRQQPLEIPDDFHDDEDGHSCTDAGVVNRQRLAGSASDARTSRTVRIPLGTCGRLAR